MPALTSVEYDAIARKQRSLYRKSGEMPPDERFNRLYGILKWRTWLQAAAEHVLRSKGSRTPGVDGVTAQMFRENLDQYLDEIQQELREGTYRPLPVRRTYIPKAKGKVRPLGIPTLKDRTVQKAVQMVLDPIYEAIFEDCSYGFRPNRRTMDTMRDIRYTLQYSSHYKGPLYEWIVEGDIKGCFDHIDHQMLMRLLRNRIRDKRFLTVIYRMLKAGVMEELTYHDTDLGTPQGGIVSPLLANVVLHELDAWFAARFHHIHPTTRVRRFKRGVPSCRLVRYADDFVIMVRGTEVQAHAIKREVGTFLDQELHLELSEEKTLVTHVERGFDFLGFHVRRNTRAKDGGTGLYIIPNKRALKNYKDKIRALTHVRNVGLRPLHETILRINWVIRGWGNYFRYVNSKRTFSYLQDWTWHRVFNLLNKRHPKTGKRKVYRMYQTHCSEALQERCRSGDYTTIGVPVPGTDKRLVLEKMDSIAIKRYPPSKHIPTPYDDEEVAQPWNVDITNTYDVRTDLVVGADRAVYAAVKPDALLRDGNQCQKCGSTENLRVHHRVARNGWKDGAQIVEGIHDLDNLATLCENCHRETHR